MRCLPVKAGEGRRKGAEALGEVRGTFVGAPRLMLVVLFLKLPSGASIFQFLLCGQVCV